MLDSTVRRSDLLQEEVVCSRLGSGLEVCVFPKPGFARKYAILATRYGSIDTEFKVDGREVATPAGIAHFLEHKLFEEEEGSIDDVFAEQGAYSNAFTNYTTTGYLFSCVDGFEENLRTLVGFVMQPHFTPENVEKEKGIIEQEIRMNDDAPDWQVVSELLKAMYHVHPVKHDIAGTVESVRSIDAETLLKCYGTFYHPSNMTLFVVGDVRPAQVLEIVDSQMSPFARRSAPLVERIRPSEPADVARSQTVKHMMVSEPLVCMGFKDQDVGFSGHRLARKVVATEILLHSFIGRSTDLYNSLYNEGIIDNSFGWDYSFDREYAMVTFDGRTAHPEAMVDRINRGIEEFAAAGVDGGTFERTRRMLLGTWLREFNSLEAIAYQYLDYHFLDMSLFDRMEIASYITQEEVMALAKNLFKDDSRVVSMVLPGREADRP